LYKILSLSCILFLLGCGPLGPVPGGELSGTVRTFPDNWASAHDIEIIQIETRPGNPYSVNIGAWPLGRISTSQRAKGPKRTGSNIYALKAIRVENEAEQAHVNELYAKKYALESEDADADTNEIWIFRLDPR